MRMRLLVSEAWRSLLANASTTLAAIVTVLVGMFILGLFIAVSTLTDSYASHVKRQLVVKIDFKTSQNAGGSATRAQVNAVAQMLQNDERVKGWVFVSKEQALAQMRKRVPDLVRELPWNPLPDSFQVTAKNADDLGAIAGTMTESLAACRVQRVEVAPRVLPDCKSVGMVWFPTVREWPQLGGH